MPAKRQLHLNVNLLASGRHDGSWVALPKRTGLSTDIGELARAAVKAERYKFDAVFFADYHGGLDLESAYRPWRALDPIPVIATLAAQTSHIGFVGTASALYGHPVSVARAYASLAHITQGRVAWNIVTSTEPHVASLYGGLPELSATERYQAADEFVAAVVALWRSVPQDAIVADPVTNAYLDWTRTHAAQIEGRLFSASGRLGIPDAGELQAVLFQAGNSEDSARFGARWADAIFTIQKSLNSAQRFYAAVRRSQTGRGPALVLPGLYPIVGSTQQEARQRKAALDAGLNIDLILQRVATLFGIGREDLHADRELPYALIEKAAPPKELGAGFRVQALIAARESALTAREVGLNLISGHRLIVGTPESIADDMQHWFEQGAADGFNLNVDALPDGLDLLGEQLIPELQRRGLFRVDYESSTLAGNLGLRPRGARNGAAS